MTSTESRELLLPRPNRRHSSVLARISIHRNTTSGTSRFHVDGDTQDTKFSLIAGDIHDARNVMAHQGYSSLQHRVEYLADEIPEGWRKDADTILMNPKLYAERFEAAFRQGSHVKNYSQLTEEVKTIRKYQFICQWLRLDRKTPILLEVKKLEGLRNTEGHQGAGGGHPEIDLCFV